MQLAGVESNYTSGGDVMDGDVNRVAREAIEFGNEEGRSRGETCDDRVFERNGEQASDERFDLVVVRREGSLVDLHRVAVGEEHNVATNAASADEGRLRDFEGVRFRLEGNGIRITASIQIELVELNWTPSAAGTERRMRRPMST